MAKMYSYNGTVLPELPAGTGAAILYQDTSKELPYWGLYSSSGFVTDGNLVLVPADSTITGWATMLEHTKWAQGEFVPDGTGENITHYIVANLGNILWASTTLYDKETGSQTYEGSTPVFQFIAPDPATITPVSATQQVCDLWGTPTPFEIRAEAADVGTLSYQWYVNDALSLGAINSSFSPPTDTVGTFTCHCVVRNTLDGKVSTAKSETFTIIVTNSLEAEDSLLLGWLVGRKAAAARNKKKGGM